MFDDVAVEVIESEIQQQQHVDKIKQQQHHKKKWNKYFLYSSLLMFVIANASKKRKKEWEKTREKFLNHQFAKKIIIKIKPDEMYAIHLYFVCFHLNPVWSISVDFYQLLTASTLLLTPFSDHFFFVFVCTIKKYTTKKK